MIAGGCRVERREETKPVFMEDKIVRVRSVCVCVCVCVRASPVVLPRNVGCHEMLWFCSDELPGS